MNTITKHTNVRKITALGITGAAASALIIGGFVAPAQAFTGDSTSTTTSTSTDNSSEQNRLDIIGDLFNFSGNEATGNGVLGNDTSVGGVGNGGTLNGGVVNGPLIDDSLTNDIGDVASGNEVGNDASVGNGTDVVAPIEAPVDAGNGTDIDGVDGGDIDSGDIDGSVDSIVNDVLGDLGLGR
ncbi:hypothetical protein E3O45_14355 [Cryobacterium sp. TMS1-20-1]|uniref:hypothetical protein n=1 Tax=Cryobacterium sp. TMS1-20-1 TaxID=1259223 RepID=UPI00106AFC0E|nr:hypothetical protein [Cryobacterium sp. TMS1-20-1]TFC71827.1 hypothetical protein E3O45_14355 [Cryobacterium sp. TMS1-20-1]